MSSCAARAGWLIYTTEDKENERRRGARLSFSLTALRCTEIKLSGRSPGL